MENSNDCCAICNCILNFLETKLAANGVSKGSISIDTNLQKKALLDSFQMIELVEFLEREFKVKFDMQDLMNKHFETIRAMGELIVSKR